MNFSKLKPLVPYISFLILALGILKTIIYYSYFNVPVKYFLSITEVVVFVFDDLAFLLVIFVVPVLILFLFLFDNVGKWNLQDHKIMASKSFVKRLLSINYLFSIILSAISVYLILTRQSPILRMVNILQVGLLLFPLLLTEMKIKYDKLNGQPFPALYWNLILVTSLTFILLSALTIKEIAEVTNGKYYGSNVVTKSFTYSSDRYSYFIGKTAEYVFIYNTGEQSCTVIPCEEVEKYRIKINP